MPNKRKLNQLKKLNERLKNPAPVPVSSPSTGTGTGVQSPTPTPAPAPVQAVGNAVANSANAAQSAQDWLASRPTPGGIAALVVIVLLLSFVLIPVDAKKQFSRLQLLFFSLAGKTQVIGHRTVQAITQGGPQPQQPQAQVSEPVPVGTGMAAPEVDGLATPESFMEPNVIETPESVEALASTGTDIDWLDGAYAAEADMQLYGG